MITVSTTAPSQNTPMFVPASEAVRLLVSKAAEESVEIDWDAGVTIKTIRPDSMSVGGTEIPVDGVTLFQASAETVEPEPEPTP